MTVKNKAPRCPYGRRGAWGSVGVTFGVVVVFGGTFGLDCTVDGLNDDPRAFGRSYAVFGRGIEFDPGANPGVGCASGSGASLVVGRYALGT